jgi:clan AA aspartic protease
MISGVVNPNLEAVVRIGVQDTGGQPHDVDAVIDTGFSGFLTLPPRLLTLLGLVWLCRQQGILADGSLHVFDVYTVTILWDGQLRPVELEAVDASPLIGLSLLQGHELRVQVVNGGSVSIESLP